MTINSGVKKTAKNMVGQSVAAKLPSGKPSIAQKMRNDKNAIAAYLRGELSLNDLQSKGIKFVKAL